MDLGFSRLDAARADPVPPPLDYAALVAGLSAVQAAGCKVAAAEALLATGAAAWGRPLAALIEIYTAGPGRAVAVTWLEGCFHPETVRKQAGMPRNASD